MEDFFPMCQRDSYCKRIEAEVISCEPHQAPPAQGSGKKGKKGGSGSNNNNSNGNGDTALYDVILSDTVLFAEAGGQPCDYGTVGGRVCKSVRVGSAGNVHVHTIPRKALAFFYLEK